MANKLHESLSALMDNEADELELRRILKEMESLGQSQSAEDISELAALKATWHRYHMVSASLKQEIHTYPSRNLLANIQAELEQEAIPAHSLAESAARKGIFRVLGQGAIAASMALAVLFTADMVMVTDNAAGDPAAQVAGAETTDQLPGFTGNLNPATNTRIAVQSRLNQEEMNRLERVVSEELEDALEAQETPAVYDPNQ